MDLKFGHGFIPRIGKGNYKAVDRCIGPASLFTGGSLDLPWAIIDGPWVEGCPELLDTLRSNQTKLLIDTFGWRYRYRASLEVGRLSRSSWALRSPVNPFDIERVKQFVAGNLRAQSRLNPDAYLVPGWMPENNTEDLLPAYRTALKVASETTDIEPRPLVAFVGGHTRGSEQVMELLGEMPGYISGVYLQLSPIDPKRDSVSKLEEMTRVYKHASDRGFSVVAGHLGAVAPTLRAMDIDAADAGLATGETFDRSRARRIYRYEKRESSKGGGYPSRMYFSEIGQSLSGSEVKRLLNVPAVAAELRGCRLPCHRFRSGNILNQAREHSLWARVQDAQSVGSLPASMRLHAVYERLREQRSTLWRINGALEEVGEKLLEVKSIDNHLMWIGRVLARKSAA